MKHVLALTALLVFLAPIGVWAEQVPAGQCKCWCGSTAGAVGYGNYQEPIECRDLCGTVNQTYLMCAKDGEMTPKENLRCWSESECTKQNTATGNPSGIFGDTQPPECMPGFRYCLPYPEPIPLSVHFGDKTFVYGIGGYIATVYRWLLGAAAVFAVLMLMVGGIQYMLSGGGGDIKEAKDRMKHAVVGFVILLASYLLLLTVNPQTLALRLPALPKIRTLLMAEGGQSCEAYTAAKYKVEVNGTQFYSNVACGTKGEVTKGPNGAQLNEEVACYFRGCPEPSKTDAGQICSINQNEETGICELCENIIGGTPGSTLVPSSSLCQGLSQLPPDSGVRQLCVFVPAGPQEDVSDAYCGNISLDCGSVDACEDYNDLVPFNTYAEEIQATHAVITITRDLEYLASRPGREGEPLLSLCSQDPCTLSAQGKSCLIRVEGNGVSCVTNSE